MKPEKLMDAMNLLPDDLLEETNAVRRRKNIPWKSLTALAACLCLIAGLWFIRPGIKTAESAKDNGTGAGPLEDCENWAFSQYSVTHSFGGREYVDVTVVCISEGYIGVIEGWREDYIIDGYGTWIDLGELDAVPELHPGQYLRLYFDDPPAGHGIPELGQWAFVPYKLEIKEE